MRLWRVSPHSTLEQASWQADAGRWHYAGRALLYLSATPELAMLEALVHHQVGGEGYWLTSMAVPARARIRTLHDDDLPADWRHRKPWSRAFGEAWLTEGRVPVLSVPSAVCPLSRNYLLNPAHAALRRIELRVEGPFQFDRRLVLRREV